MKKLFLATSLLALFASSVAFAGPIELSGGEKDMSKGIIVSPNPGGIIFCCKGDISPDEGQGFVGTDADMSKGKPMSRLTPPLADDIVVRLMNLRDSLKTSHNSGGGGVVLLNGVDINEALRIEVDAILDIYRRLRVLEPIPPLAPAPTPTPRPKP